MWATPAPRAAMTTQGKGEGLTGVRKTTMSHTPKGGYAQLERSEITEAHQGCKRYRPGRGEKKKTIMVIDGFQHRGGEVSQN